MPLENAGFTNVQVVSAFLWRELPARFDDAMPGTVFESGSGL
jgi:hypothetical protein